MVKQNALFGGTRISLAFLPSFGGNKFVYEIKPLFHVKYSHIGSSACI